jgi:hypothetical protein
MRRSTSSLLVSLLAPLLLTNHVMAQAQKDPDQKNLIAGICGTQIPLDAAGCACFAEHAMAELDEPQRAYLILTVVQPRAAEGNPIARSQKDLMAIALFIDRTQKACAAEGATAPAPGESPPAESGTGAQ